MKLLTSQEIDRLTPSERLALIADLWDSLDHAPMSAAQSSELERRLDTLDADLVDAVGWEDLRAELAIRAR